MLRIILLAACLSGALSVILGAFAAHGLKDKLDASQLGAFETGVRYQMYHTLALFVVAWLMDRFGQPHLGWAGILFMAGMVLFSGSLYLLSMRSLWGIEGWRWLGPITPLGGLAFIAGWLVMFYSLVRVFFRS